MAKDQVSLDLAAARAEEDLRAFTEGFVPLSVASATAFHQAHGNTRAIVSRDDYDDALNIAAAARTRRIPLYTVHNPRDGRVEVPGDRTR